ncbi:mannose-1-phosphate guanylyltransferase [Georgenia satyanarayanai]|uniref:mannose-1-phosphate guanylyltransferase n=1 Tax=Georgenia satyanarayanai TaxID=860221 RepID=UPI00126498E3|nr:sugar phosphate nucleotidyltransferase [Georgenia satyanarayanai]
MSHSQIPGFHAVVPAGGAGTRLWPLSRRSHPKFLLDLTGSGRTLLQGTWDRLAPLADGVTVVTGEAHATAVREQLPGLADGALLTEPSGRDSMAAIGLAAALLRERHGDVVVGSFAADHVVRRPAAFAAAVREAVAAARAGYVVTIGIEADHPSTAFGYVESGAPLGVAGAPSALHVASFAEKPDAATAATYLATGRYRWNAGMFVVRAEVLLEHLRRLQPPLHDGLLTIARAWDGPEREEVLLREWPRLTRIAIDHAVAEPAAADGGVAVVPAELGWDDVGDWRSLAALLPVGPDGVRTLGGGRTLAADSAGSVLVPATDRLVAVLGLPGAVVVDTPDALLVTTTDHAQRLKEVVDLLPDALR